MKQLKYIGFFAILGLFIISLIVIIYSLIAGIWGFNPTSIELFNAKLGFTGIIVFFISIIAIKIVEEW